MSLDQLLSECDPAPAGSLGAPGIDDALDVLGTAIVAQPRRVRQRRRRRARRRAVILVAAALVLAAGGVTAAKTLFIRTYTGTYPPKGMIAGGGPGQILRTDGTNFHQVAIQLSADIPFPSGYLGWRDAVIAEEIKTQTWHQVPSGQLRGGYAQTAICAWILDWRVAMRGGDRVRAAHDAAVLAGALHWRAVTAWDPHPSTSVPGDAGSTHPSQFGWAIPYIAAIRAGEEPRLDLLLTNLRFAAAFFESDPGFNVWWEHQPNRVRNSPRAFVDYLSTHEHG
ncbi:MAG: hypothetical protein ACTHMY_20995 [Solirubrobacteraceae bacterium]